MPTDDLRVRLAEALHAMSVCEFGDPAGCDGRCRSAANAVIAELVALCDPGDLPERMAGTLLSHEWAPNLPNTAHERHSYSADCAICDGDVRRILEVAMSARSAGC